MNYERFSNRILCVTIITSKNTGRLVFLPPHNELKRMSVTFYGFYSNTNFRINPCSVDCSRGSVTYTKIFILGFAVGG